MEKVKVTHKLTLKENGRREYMLRYKNNSNNDRSLTVGFVKFIEGWYLSRLDVMTIRPRAVITKIDSILRGLNSGSS